MSVGATIKTRVNRKATAMVAGMTLEPAAPCLVTAPGQALFRGILQHRDVFIPKPPGGRTALQLQNRAFRANLSAADMTARSALDDDPRRGLHNRGERSTDSRNPAILRLPDQWRWRTQFLTSGNPKCCVSG